MKKAARLLDNGDGSYSPLVGIAPGVLVEQATGSVFNNAGPVVIAATAALVAGDYRVEADLSMDDAAVGSALQFGRRNAANAAFVTTFNVVQPGSMEVVWSRVTLAANERIAAWVAGGAGANSHYSADIRVYKLS